MDGRRSTIQSMAPTILSESVTIITSAYKLLSDKLFYCSWCACRLHLSYMFTADLFRCTTHVSLCVLR